MTEANNSEAYRIGVLVLIILAVLTIGEFAFSTIAVTWWQPLVIIALIKAAYVIRDYMHVSRLFTPEEEELAPAQAVPATAAASPVAKAPDPAPTEEDES